MEVFFYIDMNSFFVSCHENENQNLKNKSVVVSTNSTRSVVSSASYEARKYKIKSGMALVQAFKLCPNLITVTPRRNLYNFYSKLIYEHLKNTFTNLIEQTSIDEFCLNVTHIYKQYGTTLKCAQVIQKSLLEHLNLPCSIGVSYNKTLAKIASKLKKPQGIFLITPKNKNKNLLPLKIELMPGIGPKTAEKLHNLKIKTFYDLAVYQNHELLKKNLGKNYLDFINHAKGAIIISKENNNIQKTSSKSIGRDYSFNKNTNDTQFLYLVIRKIIKNLLINVETKSLKIETIVIGIKTNKKWHTKQMKFKTIINQNQESEIKKITLVLFFKL